MITPRHKVFISYHHANDQSYKKFLTDWNSRENNEIFVDMSVNTGDIDEDLSDQVIRQKIRDEYLQDSTVTILLVGTETKRRKHIDWEIYSSMYNGQVNSKSGILVINLPTTGCENFTAAHGEQEKSILYPNTLNWRTITTRSEYERRYPYMPSRITDNLLQSDATISVTNWADISSSPDKLKLLINLAFNGRSACNYDLSTPMRRSNS